MDNKKEVIIKCTDNCSCMSIDKFNDEPEYYITFYRSYGNKSIWGRIKDVYNILMGNDVINHELIVYKNDIDKLINL